MIKLSGVTLRVKKIRGGRNGFFCLGELFTDIGDWAAAGFDDTLLR